MRRFFSADSFWNRPIARDPDIEPDSDRMMGLLAGDTSGGFWLNIKRWTIPVYEVGSKTPRRAVSLRFAKDPAAHDCVGHGPGFGDDVPIPDDAKPDPEADAHLAVVDLHSNLAWDMWGAARRPDGEWESGTGMVYAIDGSGVFERDLFPVKDGQSIHRYGPSRASGVPAIAGLIMHHEVAAGRIQHKLAFACKRNAFKKFVYPPACWTDGHLDFGIPEGAVIQLDPELDIDGLGLRPDAWAVARALQDFGAVNVDNGGGNALYGEGLYGHPGKSWDGLLDEADLLSINVRHFRVLRSGCIVRMGDVHIRESGWGRD